MTTQTAPPSLFKLSEDWLATITGLFVALVLGLGLLGPGAQSVAVTAKPGAIATKAINPLGGWNIAATIDGKKASISGAITRLEPGKTYIFVCRDGAIGVIPVEPLPEGVKPAAANQAQIVVMNICAADATVTYSLNAIVPYPLFRLF